MADYDKLIAEHYDGVADKTGLDSASTMADETIRGIETDCIRAFVRHSVGDAGRVADLGCGNGYTLSVLQEAFPSLDLFGLEYTTSLYNLARSRFEGTETTLVQGDIREEISGGPFDAAYCQRVLINLLDAKDQANGLRRVVDAVKPGGSVLFIEAFESTMAMLNEAREELSLDPIAPAHHNLYLKDDFFEEDDRLEPTSPEDFGFGRHQLSTHYFVSRVFFPWATMGKPLKRNAHFMKFFTQALPAGVGTFAPLQFRCFRRRS